MPHQDTSISRLLLMSLLVAAVDFTLNAQDLSDFEADSVYYTPLSKPQNLPVEPVREKRPVFQDTVRLPRTAYFYNFQYGHLFGQKTEHSMREVTFSTSTVHGVTLGRKLRVGVGLGLDLYYDWSALPVFGSVSWDLLGTQNTHALYVQLNYGWPISVWRSGTLWDYNTSEQVSGGPMFSPQIGYRIDMRDMRLSLSVGSRMQEFKSIYESPSFYYLPDGTIVEGSPNRTIIQQSVSRFMVNVSFGWR